MQTTRSACRSRFRRAPRPPLIALVVPYRPQAEQDRAAQLAAFLEHAARFLSASSAARFVVIVAQQSDDGRKFNRGALLNAGFREAQRLGIASVVFHDVDVCEATLGTLASVIFHDVDLLPSAGLLRHYCAPPARGECVHLAGAGAWSKYDLAGYADAFLGGVAAFQPDDFARCNGFPNEYWGWGLEDDQLRLRAAASGVRVVRPPAGAGRFDDLDELALLGALNSRPSERGSATCSTSDSSNCAARRCRSTPAGATRTACSGCGMPRASAGRGSCRAASDVSTCSSSSDNR